MKAFIFKFKFFFGDPLKKSEKAENTSSPKHSSQLKEVAVALQMQLLKLKDINAMRWVASKKQPLQAFLKSWQAMVYQLWKNSNVETSDTQKAKVLLKAICNFRFLKYCHFLYHFLAILCPLSATSQRKNLMFTEIKPSVNHAISLPSNLEKNL